MSDGKNNTNPTDIANTFNTFFSSIGKKVQNSVYPEHVHFTRYLNNPSNSIFYCSNMFLGNF